MITYKEYNLEETPEAYNTLITLYEQVFDEAFTQEQHDRLASKNKPLVLIACHNNQPAGFKVAYALTEEPDVLYSWLGGVLPDFRRQGIAEKLMKEQHRQAKENGFTAVETKSYPGLFPAMMQLNYKYGFKLIREYHCNKLNETKVQLRKPL